MLSIKILYKAFVSLCTTLSYTVGHGTPPCSRAGVFNLLSWRASLHLSYNPAGRSHCRLQNHHGYIKHNHRGIGGSPGDGGKVSDAGEATERLYNEL